jgi:anti-sigma factor RsiW
MTCPHGDTAPELALGLLTGAERAEAVAHLHECAAYRAEVARLTDVADALRDLTAAEPPAGFETRVLARLADTDGSPVAGGVGGAGGAVGAAPTPAEGRERWTPRRAPLLIAAGLVGVAVFGAGWAAGSGRPSSSAVVTAAVAEPWTSGERRVGDIVVDRDRPDRLSVWLEAPEAGPLTCELLRRDGSVAASVSYDARGGAEWWGVPRPDGEVSRMRIADAAGGEVASGAIPPPL